MLKPIYQATITATDNGVVLNGRQLPKEVDLPLALAITRLEAALAGKPKP